MKTNTLLKSVILSMTLGLALLPSQVFSAITVDSVTGIWQNVLNGDNLTGVGTNEIRWGSTDTSTNSGYRFDGVAPPAQAVTIDTAFNLGTFTHFNFPIPSGSSIDGATLKTTVDLNINGTAVSGLTFSYNFLHNETPNVAGSCPAGSVSICDDIVKVENNIAQSSVFDIGGIDYTLKVLGFDIGGGSDTFLTEEGKTNMAPLQGIITQAVAVPEPSTYLILASCLIACYFLRRAKRVRVTERNGSSE